MKRDYLPHELGESTVDAMRKVCIPLTFFFSHRPPYDPFLPSGGEKNTYPEKRSGFERRC